MICTVTLNPSLDYILHAAAFAEGKVNRAEREEIFPGGKGINVSRVLAALGIRSAAYGFAAGFTGEELRRLVRAYGIDADFLPVAGMTRINVKIRSGKETDINASGPSVREEDLRALAEKLRLLPENSVLVLAGSAPSSLSNDCYARLVSYSGRSDLRIALDTSGKAFARSLALAPWLIKPNAEELEEAVGEKLSSRGEIASAAERLQERGARNVIVSLGGDGALLVSESGERIFVPAPQGKAVDTVGAGDSLLAGFLAAKEQGVSDAEALAQGVAAGSATAFRIGIATGEEIRALLMKMRSEK